MVAERLRGLLLILLGCVSLMLVYLAQQHGWLQLRPPTPPGARPELLPVITPLSCVLPMAAIGALGLCLAGLQKLLGGDDWQAPKHIDSLAPPPSPVAARTRPARSRSRLRRFIRRLIGASR
jgi:hypothetical protein